MLRRAPKARCDPVAMLLRLPPLGLLAALLVACGSSSLAGATAQRDLAPPGANAAAGGVRLRAVGHFSQPLFVTSPPADRRRLMVVEQGGRIRVVRAGHVLSRPFLDVRSKIVSGGEQGLLGLAFAPDYARSGLLYVYYTGRDGRENVVEYQVDNLDLTRSGTNPGITPSAGVLGPVGASLHLNRC